MKDGSTFDMDSENEIKPERDDGEYCDICQLLFHVDDLIIPDKDHPKVKICEGCLKGVSQ